MKIACWNCADGLATKRAMLDRLEGDILVVAEVRLADFARVAPDFAGAVYRPSASARGLAVFARGPGLQVRRFRVPGQAECYEWVQAGGVDILAAWVKSAGDYVRPAHQVVAHFLRQSRAAHRIVLGDLNLNPGFDGRRKSWRAADLVGHLGRHGLRSLYHEATGEAMGAETRATHHFTYNAARPFHIDFIFASRDLGLVQFGMGEADRWMGAGRSDHVPLWAELRLPETHSIRAAAGLAERQ